MPEIVEEFRIELENSEDVFFSGKNISGKLLLKLSIPCQIRSVHLTITGKGDVRFKTNDSTGNPKTVHRETTYIADHWTLFEVSTGTTRDSKKHRRVYGSGVTEFPFHRPLPSELPTSYDGSHGYIRYSLKASLHIPHHGMDHATKSIPQPESNPKIVARKGFTVLRGLETRSLPNDNLLKPVDRTGHVSTGKSLLNCCGATDINFVVKLPRVVFVPGENVPINGQLENNSNKRIEKATVRIELHADHFGNSGSGYSARFKREICRGTCAIFVNKGSQVRLDHALPLPPLVPSTDSDLLHSQTSLPPLIRISYELIFSVQLPGMKSVDTALPLVIGTVPSQAAVDKRPRTGRDPTVHKGVPLSVAYRAPFWEKTVNWKRQNEHYFCDERDLEHVNKYPFWMGLANASKFSKRMGSAAAKR